jgi:hypothetical protein
MALPANLIQCYNYEHQSNDFNLSYVGAPRALPMNPLIYAGSNGIIQ